MAGSNVELPDPPHHPGSTFLAWWRGHRSAVRAAADDKPTQPTSAGLATWILGSAVLGLLVGILIGERASLLQPLGLAYAKMLEISVFPYLICSLLLGLGGLAPERAPRLLRSSWPIYLIVWATTLATLFLLGLVIPSPPLPNLLTPGSQPATAANLIDLLIPANLASSLYQNAVPAIVVFAILFGIAIQSNPQKTSFLDAMEVLRKASVTIWTWVVYFAPVGVFALFASTAGTVDPKVADSLLAYMALYLLGTFLLAFVVIPLALRPFVSRGAREILAELRPALTLALVTTLSAAALPQVQKVAERLLAERGVTGEEAKDVVRATLSLSYVLCQLGNYFIALFVLYLSYHYRAPLSLGDMVLLPFMTLLAGIGSPSASVEAVAFLAQWLNLPADAPNLYIETMTVTRYGQVALSVMGFSFVTLAVPMIYFGCERCRTRGFLPALAGGLVLFGAIVLGGRMIESRLFPSPSDAAILARTLAPGTTDGVTAVVHRERPAALATLDGAADLEAIRRRGQLRVGYGADIVPFSYVNGQGDLVGYDVAAAYRLARALHVGIEFVPVTWHTLEADVDRGLYDIVMAGAYATSERLRTMDVSSFYLTSPLAFIVPSAAAPRFLAYDLIAARDGLRLAIFKDPVLEPLVRDMFPRADIRILPSYDVLPDDPSIDGALWTADQAAAWTSARSGYTAVVPQNIGAPLPLAYLLPRGSDDFVRYVNLWLALEQAQGLLADQVDYWIRGHPRPEPDHRWNVLDDMILPFAARHGWIGSMAG
ncbi:MAG TPA: cation:dicarboxylase symporter family transporter [Geminicoccus sp.]|jgi:Na+/H+-dicarboxylate symporter/ABC-type amino acid transport substrate-binding protein|uniref:cation:dicarboxylate symporter family transporter n=1 Tax=Geminicoccus sp. TaxID=2024832 RepID=UPI002E30A3F0|nr:cation:dicarboxylase symporter family transporter [Geminicoccus sp.]HEX2529249.1 cation:dicarboxylase symporter family transporter [Geminicoccus sp.]